MTAPSTIESHWVGKTLEGRYEIVGEIGEGGMGSVFRARHLKLGHEVAIKMLLPQFVEDATIVPRFEREARALASLSHPNIVTLIDYSVTDGRPYLVMEMLEGRTLDSVLEKGPLDEKVARYIAMQVADALAYAHEIGFVHRDLKPANIFLVRLPTDEFHVKILDFGFVKLIADDRPGEAVLTQTGIAFGTPYYMSPEQATGDATDARTDIYAFGVILFEMLAGRRPFIGSLPEIIRQHLTTPMPTLQQAGAPCAASPELESLLARATAKEKAERYPTAAELRDALVELPDPMVVPSAPIGDAPTLFGAVLSTAEATSKSLRALATSGTLRDDATMPAASSASVTGATFRTRPGTTKTRELSPKRKSHMRWVGAIALALTFGGALLWLSGGDDAEAPPPSVGKAAAEKSASAPTKSPPGKDVPDEEKAAKKLAAASAEVVDSLVNTLDETMKGAREKIAHATSTSDFGPDPWKTNPPTKLLDAGRERVLGGQPLSKGAETGIRKFARRNKGDPRPHLVIAQSFLNRGQHDPAMQRYDLAYRVNEEAKGDPNMLSALLQMASEGDAKLAAGDLIAKAYGKDAIPSIDEQLSDTSLPAARAEELKKLRARLENPDAYVPPTPKATKSVKKRSTKKRSTKKRRRRKR